MLSPSLSTSISDAGAGGTSARGDGRRCELTFLKLREKYLTYEDEGVFADEDRARLYQRLARMDAARLTIFLLFVELGNKSEVARRLGAHRNTVSRIIEGIRRELI